MIRSILAALVIFLVVPTARQAVAVEAVIISSSVKWKCEGGLQIELNDESGDMRIVSRSASIDMTLPLYYCHSSHCDWGSKAAAAECGEAPCAEIVASPTEQFLTIDLTGFESKCEAKKPR